ncbi:MAG: TolB family protein [Alloprevotella sp.]
MKNNIFLLVLAACLFAACARQAEIPVESTPVNEIADIYPDYRDIVVPPNIAPLNFMVKSEGDEYVAAVTDGKRTVTAGAAADGKLAFDSTEWRQLLTEAKGKELAVTVYAKRGADWVQFPKYSIGVAEEPIDPYLSYRLIEPSYELYRQLGLYQRNLENFSESVIYENNRSYDRDNNHCVNCHNYQAYDTQHMLFHVRAQHGGTVFVENGKVRKVNMKCDSILSSTVYPTWHPKRNWVVFSSNQTGQTFHMVNRQKIEVVDYGSDLVFFDADKNTLTNILKTDSELETFPCWTPDGKSVVYCSARVPQFAGMPDSVRRDRVSDIYDSLHYSLRIIDFDEQTRRFSAPRTLVDADSLGTSIAVPRVSPDGRYVLFTMADYGQFHIWHKNADLYVKDLQTGEVRPLTPANSEYADSYHTWSSNGRWIVVASRREDNNYSRVFIAYFDKDGQAHKAFLLPQEDPEHNILLEKSYNVPELTKTAVPVTPEELKKAIYDDGAAQKVRYKKPD